MKKLLSIILTITMLCSMAIAVFADDTVNDSVKVGINAEFKPFEYYEGDELKGFDIELMNLIGEKIGTKIEFVNMNFDALIPAVLSGRVDCAISAITVTEDRDKVIDYSREYLRTMTVTFENGQKSRKYGEDYAIVFRDGVSQAKYRSSVPTDYEKLYMDIDNVLCNLSQDGTVGKLIEKYDLNQLLDETKENIEYMDVRGCGTPPSKTSATSVPASKWAADSIEIARKINIISGNYNFPGVITREEFCELVFNYIKNFPGSAFSVGIIKPPFTDTDNEHIEVLNALGIVKGKSETEFAPNDSLTREEAAVILYRMISKIYPGWDATAQYFDFADSGQISDWAMNDIQVICNMGIMQGVGDNRFAPKELYTTEQAIATLVRVYNNFAKSNDISNAENLVDEKFIILTLPWGEKWENIKDRSALSTASVVVDDGNRFAIEISNAEFLGVSGKMVLQFSVSNDAFPNVGLVKAYFSYDEKDEKEVLAQGNKIYGERKSYFLDKNGIENPLNPSAWYSDENMDNSLESDERAYYEKLLSDKDVEETRADAILRGPLVVISVNEDDNIVTINGNKAADIFNLRNYMP